MHPYEEEEKSRSAREEEEEEEEGGGKQTPFDWWRQWYPVAVIQDLEPDLPTKVW